MSGLEMRYFVLKPKGNDQYAAASRKAMRAYASMIESVNIQMAADLRAWADREQVAAIPPEPQPPPLDLPDQTRYATKCRRCGGIGCLECDPK